MNLIRKYNLVQQIDILEILKNIRVKFGLHDKCLYFYDKCRYMGLKNRKSANEQETIFLWLGVKKSSFTAFNSSFNYMRLIKEGLRSNSINSFIEHSGLSQKQVSGIIHISERTIQRNSPDQPINISTSEKLVELARLFYKGIEVFNDKEKFKAWLIRPNKSMASQTPLSIMETSIGIDLIFDELIRIEHGVFS